MRAFVAIEVPEDIRKRLQDMQDVLRGSRIRASWVKPDAMHLTLRFLGEISESEAEKLFEYLGPRFRDVASFDLGVAGVGAFPNVRRPSVVWAGIGPLEGSLAQAQEIAEAGALAIGQKPEGRRFHPHVTLARIKQEPGKAAGDKHAESALAALIEREQKAQFGAFTAKKVSLFSSELTSRGPIYTRVKEFCFS